MAYCVYGDVGMLLSLTFDEVSSKPLASKVTEVITLISSEINLTLKSVGIDAPLAGTDLYNVVKLMTMKGAAGVIGISYYGNTEDVAGSQGDYYQKEYRQFLKDIKTNPELLKNISYESIIGNQITNGTVTEESISDILIGDDWTA